eukprot:9239068-Alexandrium_andersonii.AAC.1
MQAHGVASRRLEPLGAGSLRLLKAAILRTASSANAPGATHVAGGLARREAALGHARPVGASTR